MKERVKYCDTLKFIAIILVILIHIFAIYRDMYINTNKMYYFLLSFGDAFTRVAVPIFFMITGIFMLSKKPEKNYKEYFWKRLPKLVVPLTIFSIIYYIYETIKLSNEFSILTFLQQITSSGGVKYHFWFMYEIIKIYLLIPFIAILIEKIDKKNLKNLIILIFILGNIVHFIQIYTARYHLNLFTGLSLSTTAICINYLLVGYYLYKYDIKQTTRKKIYILGIISILLLPVADFFFIDGVRNDEMFTVSSIFTIIPSIAFFLLFKYNYQKWNISSRVESLASKVASQSLYIYMSHVMILEIVLKYVQKILPPERFIYIPILILIILIITTIFSYIFSKVFDWIYRKIEKLIKLGWGKIVLKMKRG